jgi:hypothetical protein
MVGNFTEAGLYTTGISTKVTEIGTDLTVTLSHSCILANATGGVINITMPLGITVPEGREWVIKKVDASLNYVNILVQGGDLLDTSPAPYPLKWPGTARTIKKAVGVNWVVL